MDCTNMTEIKKVSYRMSGVTVTVEYKGDLELVEHCPTDNDLLLFVQDHLLLHLKRK